MSVECLGRYIKERRLGQSMSQERLGQIAGRTQSYISRLENAGPDHPMPDGDTLEALAGHFGVTSRYLLTLAGYKVRDSEDDEDIDLTNPEIRFAIGDQPITDEERNKLIETYRLWKGE